MTHSGPRVVGGRYRLDRPIGRGGMGQVWAGTDERLGRTVAVKLIRGDLDTLADDAGAPEDSHEGSDLRARFDRECRTAARLDHPGIVGVHDAGVDDDGRLYLVMQYVAGVSLSDLVGEEGPLPVDQAVAVAGQLAAALSAVHAAGVVHRDIKPGNVIVRPDGRVVLLDLGISAAFEPELSRLTRSGTPLGTPSYMAPEQAVSGTLEPRSDLYALGCLLHAVLTGEPPFTGASAVAVMHGHYSLPPRPLRQLRPEVPAALERLTLDLLAKSPADRPSSAVEVYGRLLALMPEVGGTAGSGVAGAGVAGSAGAAASGAGVAVGMRGAGVGGCGARGLEPPGPRPDLTWPYRFPGAPVVAPVPAPAPAPSRLPAADAAAGTDGLAGGVVLAGGSAAGESAVPAAAAPPVVQSGGSVGGPSSGSWWPAPGAGGGTPGGTTRGGAPAPAGTSGQAADPRVQVSQQPAAQDTQRVALDLMRAAELHDQGQYAQAAALVGAVIARTAAVHGPQGPRVLSLRRRRAQLLMKDQQFPAALAEFAALAAAIAALRGRDDPVAMDCGYLAARCQAKVGDAAGALAAYRDLLALHQDRAARGLESDPDRARRIRLHIGELLMTTRDLAGAWDVLLGLLMELEPALGPQHARVREVRTLLDWLQPLRFGGANGGRPAASTGVPAGRPGPWRA